MRQDKDFLGKEPVGRLLLRLALPTVTAQIINMLYNIVDRIYIGHIPGYRRDGADRRGSLYAADYDRIGLRRACRHMAGLRGPRSSWEKNNQEAAEKTLGNCFVMQLVISVLLTAALLLWNRDFLMAFGASENTIEYGVALYEHLCHRHRFCTDDTGNECVYHRTGICQNRYAVGADRRGGQHYSGSDLYFRLWIWACAARRWRRLFPRLCPAPGCWLFLCGKKTHLKIRIKEYAALKAEYHPALPGAGLI